MMVKKALWAVLACLLCCSLAVFAACGGDVEGNDDNNNNNNGGDNNNETVAVTDITLNADTLTLEADGTAVLTATVAPANATDKTVSWTVADDNAEEEVISLSAATGESVTVTAVAAGTATVTAASGDASAACTVTVSDMTVDSAEDLADAVADEANEGKIIAVSASVESALDISADNVTLVAADSDVEFSGAVTVSGTGVTLSGITVSTDEAIVPVTATGEGLTLINCTVERTTESAPAYGYLVSANNGTFTAKNCTFIAPYDPETAFEASPSVIEATGGVDLDGCTIMTDGYGFFSQHVTKGTVKDTTFTGIDGRPTLGCLNSTLFDGIVFDGCTFDMGENSTVAAGSFTFRNCVFNFENTPEDGAGNAISVYMQTGNIVIEDNVFNLREGARGVNLTWADWAAGDHDASKVTIEGNTFNGTGACTIRITNVWTNVPEDQYAGNTFNGNSVIVEPATEA